jgi:hypothetical protein
MAKDNGQENVDRIKVKCPECERELDGRGFKNHMYNEHGATKDQALQAWLDATGRNPISWKAMQKQAPYKVEPSSASDYERGYRDGIRDGYRDGYRDGLGSDLLDGRKQRNSKNPGD